MMTSAGSCDVIRQFRRLLPFLVLTLTSCVGDERPTQKEPREYCENETFRAACGSDEVIVARSASYGRMRISKCIDRDYGYVGCSADVLHHADRKCSGKRKCEIRIPDPLFGSDLTCPRDLKPYLEIGYDCIKVQPARRKGCYTPHAIPLKERHGLIASILTEESGIGSADCPWLITAPPGQRINLTLHDFGLADTEGEACHAYAIIREREPARSLTICNGRQRIKQAYISVSNQVEVRILKAQHNTERGRHFILDYQMIGCPDLKLSPGTWMKRSTDGTAALIGCTGTETSWRVQCKNNQWKGRIENCTEVAVGAIHSREWGIVSLPFGLSVIIVVTIALTIGIIFMIIGLACLRWRRKRESDRAQQAKKENTYYTGFMPSQAHHKSPDRRHLTRELPWPPPPTHQEHEALYGENEYSYIADVPLPPPPPQVSTTHAHNDTRDLPEPPKYFVLEPNGTESLTSDVSPPPERYVGIENQIQHTTNSLNSWKKHNGTLPIDGDLFSHQNGFRRSQQVAHQFGDFREPGRDERGHNHVSV